QVAHLLLGDDRLVRERAASPAVLGRDRRAEQPDGAGLVPDLAVDVLLLSPPGLVGRAFLLEERRGQLAERLGVLVAPGRAGGGHGKTFRRRVSRRNGRCERRTRSMTLPRASGDPGARSRSTPGTGSAPRAGDPGRPAAGSGHSPRAR